MEEKTFEGVLEFEHDEGTMWSVKEEGDAIGRYILDEFFDRNKYRQYEGKRVRITVKVEILEG